MDEQVCFAGDMDMALMDDELAGWPDGTVDDIPDPISDALTGEDWEQLSKEWAYQRALHEREAELVALRERLAAAEAREVVLRETLRDISNGGVLPSDAAMVAREVLERANLGGALLKRLKQAEAERDAANQRAERADADAAALRAALERAKTHAQNGRSHIRGGLMGDIEDALNAAIGEAHDALAQANAGAALLARVKALEEVAEAARAMREDLIAVGVIPFSGPKLDAALAALDKEQ